MNIFIKIITINIVISVEKEIIHKVKKYPVSSDFTVNDLIKQTLTDVNNELIKEKSKFRLTNNILTYNVKPSKKNGYPKDDLPCKYLIKTAIKKDCCIVETNYNNLSLIVREDNIFQEVKKCKCKSGCLLF